MAEQQFLVENEQKLEEHFEECGSSRRGALRMAVMGSFGLHDSYSISISSSASSSSEGKGRAKKLSEVCIRSCRNDERELLTFAKDLAEVVNLRARNEAMYEEGARREEMRIAAADGEREVEERTSKRRKISKVSKGKSGGNTAASSSTSLLPSSYALGDVCVARAYAEMLYDRATSSSSSSSFQFLSDLQALCYTCTQTRFVLLEMLLVPMRRAQRQKEGRVAFEQMKRENLDRICSANPANTPLLQLIIDAKLWTDVLPPSSFSNSTAIDDENEDDDEQHLQRQRNDQRNLFSHLCCEISHLYQHEFGRNYVDWLYEEQSAAKEACDEALTAEMNITEAAANDIVAEVVFGRKRRKSSSGSDQHKQQGSSIYERHLELVNVRLNEIKTFSEIGERLVKKKSSSDDEEEEEDLSAD
jgi:hypothetical protein